MLSAVNHVTQWPSSRWSHDGKGGLDIYPHETNFAYTQRPETGAMHACCPVFHCYPWLSNIWLV